jgi:autotransporter-associated beta strand protein
VSGGIANNAGTNTTASNIAALGGGLVILAGNNTYSGTTTVFNTGTELRIGNGGTTGNLGNGAVTVNAGLLSFNRSNVMTVNNSISGSGRVSQIGAGTTILTNGNTYTGATTISAGTLEAGAANALGNNTTGTSGITVSSGGTLRLSNNATNDHVRDTAGLTLAGGTLSMNGVSEGAAGVTGIGALTLTANSIIDFAAGVTNSIIQFAGLGAHTASTGPDLSIMNWNGTPRVGGGSERLLFQGTSGDFTTKFAQNDVSFNGFTGYRTVDYGSYYEVTAVPEPSTYVAGLLAIVVVACTQYRRATKLRKRAA